MSINYRLPCRNNVILSVVFFLASILAFASTASAQGARYDGTTQARSGFPAPSVSIAVCTQPAVTTTTPCSALATLYTDATLAVQCSGVNLGPNIPGSACSNPMLADSLGNFHFYAQADIFTLQFYGSGITTYSAPDVRLSGSLVKGVSISPSSINSVVYLDGTTNKTLATCYAAIAANGGACVVPPNYTETMAASLTMSKSGAGFIFLGPATITMGSNQVIVPAATHGVYLKGGIPFGGGLFATGKGVTFTYTGSGKAFQVGDGAGATNRVFEFSDITVDLSGASSGASGLYMTNVVYFKLNTPSVVGNNSTTGTKGIVCDGTGNFCGTGTIINPYMTGLGTGILGTGSGGSAMNAAVIIGGTVGSSVVGAIGLDIENGDSSSVYGLDLESLATAVKLGANAAGNFIRIRQEANTTDVQALAGSQFNVVQVERANVPVVSDAGTSNQFYRMQDGKFLNVYTPVIQSPAGGNTALVDNASVTQAAVVPGAFEVFNIFALAAGAKIQDASSGVHAGVTLKSGSGGGNYTGTNTGYGNVDTTNLCTVLTIPTGWKLTVVANGVIESVTAAVAQSFALSDIGTTCGGAGTTPLAGSERTYTPPAIATFDVGLSTQAVINGDGLAHAISLQAKTSAGADAWGIQNTSSSAAPSMIFTLMPSN